MALRRVKRGRRLWLALLAAVATMTTLSVMAIAAAPSGASYAPNAYGSLDCNHESPVQTSVHLSAICTDIRGFDNVTNQNNWGGRFYDNGVYIGHDEPDMTFLSSTPGSGDNVTWHETLGADPTAKPTDSNPGHDVADYFELTPAPWFSMMMCDGNSYPQLPCTPENDENAPSCPRAFKCPQPIYPGAGSAFMEMQFYPPGFAPFSDGISCDNTRWCAALTIDSLECTYQYYTCNPNCEEPVNFAYVSKNGSPSGPPNPQDANILTFTPNVHTLLMNQGDKLTVHMADAPVPGGTKGEMAFKVTIDDLTTGQSGTMQASAKNGFQNTSMVDCSGTPFDFQPEYNTAKEGNINPWAALQTDISTEFETGHFEPCTRLSQPFTVTVDGITDNTWNECHGPYERTAPGQDGQGNPEAGDAFCFPQGDTHGAQYAPPDTITGCEDDYYQNGDLDFDGIEYWAEWPTGTSATGSLPSSFQFGLPVSGGANQYPQFFFQTDLALSESVCTESEPSNCTVPPNGPGKFYPYWNRVDNAGKCSILFGNVSSVPGGNDYGMDAQYGKVKWAGLGYPEFEGPVMSNSCT